MVTTRILALVAVLLCASASLGACTSTVEPSPSAPPATGPATTSPTAGPSATTAGPTGPPTSPTSGLTPGGSSTDGPSTWSSQPRIMERTPSVPPVPGLLAIRPGSHPADGFDRVTFDFRSALPGYDIRYVDRVIEDGSGKDVTVTVPGRRYLQVTFQPAYGHNESGTAVTPAVMTLDYPMLKAYAVTGDFEAVLTIVLGLDDTVGYRVGELPGQPGRIYVDVAA